MTDPTPALTDAEREALDNAMPAVTEGTEGWEWGVLYRAVARIRADAVAAAFAPVERPDLYIAGPMTGLPEFNFPAFYEAERRLDAAHFDTRNPARHGAGQPGQEWADYMRRDIPDLLACAGVALLPGWEKSRGACLEVHIAEALGMPVKTVDEWLRAALAEGKEKSRG